MGMKCLGGEKVAIGDKVGFSVEFTGFPLSPREARG